MKTLRSSKTPETDWQVTRRRTPDERSPQTHRGEKLQTRMPPDGVLELQRTETKPLYQSYKYNYNQSLQKSFQKITMSLSSLPTRSQTGDHDNDPTIQYQTLMLKETLYPRSRIASELSTAQTCLDTEHTLLKRKSYFISLRNTLQKELIHTALLPGPYSKLKIT
jgi:hypothetical protein